MINRTGKVGDVLYCAIRVKPSGESPQVAVGETLEKCMVELDNYMVANDPTESNKYMIVRCEVSHVITPMKERRAEVKAIRDAETAHQKEVAARRRKQGQRPPKPSKPLHGW